MRYLTRINFIAPGAYGHHVKIYHIAHEEGIEYMEKVPL